MKNNNISHLILIVSIAFSPLAIISILGGLFALGLSGADEMQFVLFTMIPSLSVILGIIFWVISWRKNRLQNSNVIISALLTIFLLEVIPLTCFVLLF